jgi:hypothetical protein
MVWKQAHALNRRYLVPDFSARRDFIVADYFGTVHGELIVVLHMNPAKRAWHMVSMLQNTWEAASDYKHTS